MRMCQGTVKVRRHECAKTCQNAEVRAYAGASMSDRTKLIWRSGCNEGCSTNRSTQKRMVNPQSIAIKLYGISDVVSTHVTKPTNNKGKPVYLHCAYA